MNAANSSPVIREISESVKRVALNGDLFPIAAALLIALVAYSFLQALVEGLIGPAIALVFSKPGLYAMSFRVEQTEFGYGAVLSGLILLVLAFGVVARAGKVRQASNGRSSDA